MGLDVFFKYLTPGLLIIGGIGIILFWILKSNKKRRDSNSLTGSQKFA